MFQILAGKIPVNLKMNPKTNKGGMKREAKPNKVKNKEAT